jgi:hypothetical protein
MPTALSTHSCQNLDLPAAQHTAISLLKAPAARVPHRRLCRHPPAMIRLRPLVDMSGRSCTSLQTVHEHVVIQYPVAIPFDLSSIRFLMRSLRPTTDFVGFGGVMRKRRPSPHRPSSHRHTDQREPASGAKGSLGCGRTLAAHIASRCARRHRARRHRARRPRAYDNEGSITLDAIRCNPPFCARGERETRLEKAPALACGSRGRSGSWEDVVGL